MTAAIITLLVLFAVLLILRVPLAFAMALSGAAAVAVGGIKISTIIQSFYSGTQSWVLMAIPFFVLTGTLMEAGGLSDKLLTFVDRAFGFLPGGLANVNIGGSALFGGISGSAVADTSALGPILIPAMESGGFSRPYSAAVTAASSPLSMIIPPSIPMIVWSSVTGASLGGLFLGGLLPGVLVAVLMMVLSYGISRKRGYPVERRPFSWTGLVKSAIDGVVVLVAPIIIIAGIYTGFFTPTEAGAAAVGYVALILIVGYRSLPVSSFLNAVKAAGRTSASIMFLLAGAGIFSYVLSRGRVPELLGEAIFDFAGGSPGMVMLLGAVVLFLCGMFLDITVIILLVGPMLGPLVTQVGIDPVHAGIIFMIVLATGLITPPLGLCLFVASSVGKVRFERVVREVVPFVALYLGIALLLWFVPVLVTGLSEGGAA